MTKGRWGGRHTRPCVRVSVPHDRYTLAHLVLYAPASAFQHSPALSALSSASPPPPQPTKQGEKPQLSLPHLVHLRNLTLSPPTRPRVLSLCRCLPLTRWTQQPSQRLPLRLWTLTRAGRRTMATMRASSTTASVSGVACPLAPPAPLAAAPGAAACAMESSSRASTSTAQRRRGRRPTLQSRGQPLQRALRPSQLRLRSTPAWRVFRAPPPPLVAPPSALQPQRAPTPWMRLSWRWPGLAQSWAGHPQSAWLSL